jgi:hypothetical protein
MAYYNNRGKTHVWSKTTNILHLLGQNIEVEESVIDVVSDLLRPWRPKLQLHHFRPSLYFSEIDLGLTHFYRMLQFFR